MGHDHSRPLRSALREALILFAYGALALFATRPLLSHFTSAIPGGNDSWLYVWDLWWVKRSLLELRSPFHTQLLHFPYGARLYFHTLNLLPSYLALPAITLGGLAAGYNVQVIASFIATGYFSYLLALFVLADEERPTLAARGGAFVAGVIFTFSSYRFAHLLGHLDLLNTQWLPLFVLCLLKARDGSRPIWIVLCGASLAAAALTAWYYAICLLSFVVMLTIDVVLTRADWPSVVRRIAIATAVFLVLVSPVLAPMLFAGVTGGRTPDPMSDAIRFSPDLLAFITPSYVNGVWSRWVGTLYDPNGGIEQIAFLGFIPLALGTIGVLTRARTLRLWPIAFVAYCLLALGPVLHVAGHIVRPVSWFMPYRWLMWLPYGDIPRVPGRFMVMATLALSVLAGQGARRLFARRPDHAAILLALIVVAGMLENAGRPVQLQSVRAPAYFEELSREDAGGGLLEIPIPDDPQRFPERMLWQTTHAQPVFGGYLARGLPPLPFDAIPGFSQLKSGRWEIEDIVRYDPNTLLDSSRTVLSAYHTRFIVLEKSLLPQAEADRLRSIADMIAGKDALVHEDDSLRAYRWPEGLRGGGPTMWLDRGWSYLEHGDGTDASVKHARWRWIADEARLGIATEQAVAIRVQLTAQSFRTPRRLEIRSQDGIVAAFTLPSSTETLETPTFEVPAGVTFLVLKSLDGAERPGTDRRQLSFAFFELRVSRS